MRHAGHGHALPLGDVARGEHDVQLVRHRVGVVVKGLVKIAQPKEEDGIRVLALDCRYCARMGVRFSLLGMVTSAALSACSGRRAAPRGKGERSTAGAELGLGRLPSYRSADHLTARPDQRTHGGRDVQVTQLTGTKRKRSRKRPS